MRAGPLVINTLACTLAINTAFGVLGALLTGCATPTPPTPAQANLANLTKTENLPGKPGCFWKSSFQGDWTVLNDTTLIVHAPLPKDAFVIKLFEPVFSLNFKQGLGFEDREHTGQICSNGDDYLLVPGWQPPQVPIVAVRALTSPEEAQLLRAAGLPVPPHSHAAAQP
jgi:hypothetical protein